MVNSSKLAANVVTGADGFIGSHLTERLVEASATVDVFANTIHMVTLVI